jgi:DNA modification methylase
MMIQGNALHLPLAAGTVQCCVTSPPYWGLRDYGVAGQLGLESTPDDYVASMVSVFREVRRVLRDDGVLFLNLGDSYATGGGKCINPGGDARVGIAGFLPRGQTPPNRLPLPGLKPKDLVGIPWAVAFALRDSGWYLRSDIIWAKPNPMPESVTDRPTKSHEYVFLLTKSSRYYWDAEAVREPFCDERMGNPGCPSPKAGIIPGQRAHTFASKTWTGGAENGGRNIRSVWTIATQPYPEAHFATMPEKLVEPCIKAGSKPGDLVLDPFAGSGTVGVVCRRYARRFVGVELNPAYISMASRRLRETQPGLAYA